MNKIDKIISNYLEDHQHITRIDWLDNDLTIYFKDSDEPWSINEFKKNSKMWLSLSKLESQLILGK